MPFDFPVLYFMQDYIVSPILNNVMIIASALGEYYMAFVGNSAVVF